MTFLLLALLAHVVADFVLQPDNVVESKGRQKLGGYLRHGTVVFLCSVAAFHPYGLGTALLLAAAISLAHIAIDWLKNLVDRGASPARSLGVFVADQCAHAAVLLATQELANASVVHLSDKVVWFYREVLLAKTTVALAPAWAGAGLSLDRALVVAIAYIVAIFAGAVVVRRVLDAFSISVEPRLATNAGRYIGMVERVLMLTLVLVDALPSIAFVLTAKSLARFQELNDMRFAEYYLVGTLTSACVALAIGVVAATVLPTL
ncbi:MAG: DUF3307 domain-containing protein [Bacteroidota bacterium]